MTIKRSGIAEPVSSNNNSFKIPSYCEKCSQQKLRGPEQILKPRVFFPHETPDPDRWMQCYYCGTIYPIYNVKKESALTSDLEIKENPFGRTQTDETEHYQPPKHRRGFNERLQRDQEEIKDEDIKKELKKGATLISYQETNV